METLELKSTITGMKNLLKEFNSKLEMAEKPVNTELEEKRSARGEVGERHQPPVKD